MRFNYGQMPTFIPGQPFYALPPQNMYMYNNNNNNP